MLHNLKNLIEDAMEFIIRTIVNVVMLWHTIFNNENEFDEEDVNDLIQLHINRLRRRVGDNRNQPNRCLMFVERTIANSTATEFYNHFRMQREAFEWLHITLAPKLQSERLNGRQMVEPHKQLLAVIWLIATPESYRSIGNRFDMGKSTLYACFIRVIKALNELAPRLIVWPTGARAVRNERNFFRMANIRGVIGAIDGTYVPIKAPSENPEAYINRKCFYAMTLQCICDSSLVFTDCFTGYPSSVSDIRIFRNSDIYDEFEQRPNNYFQENQFIIGDKAYPVNKWCIRPYIDRGNLPRWQTDFNVAHARTRQVIERSFALLFGRFRRLKYLDMNRVDLIPATIIAACVLHNVCRNQPDDLADFYEVEGRRFIENMHLNNGNDGQREDIGNIVQEGIQFRDRLARNLQL